MKTWTLKSPAMIAALTTVAGPRWGQAIPDDVQAILKKQSLDKRLEVSTKLQPFYLRGDFDGDYSAWHAGLFPSLAAALHLPERVVEAQAPGPRFSFSFINKLAASPIVRSYSAVAMTVRTNRELQRRDCERPSERSTRHLDAAEHPHDPFTAGEIATHSVK